MEVCEERGAEEDHCDVEEGRDGDGEEEGEEDGLGKSVSILKVSS